MKPWEKFLQVHGINDYAMMDGLRSYHKWLQSEGMLRDDRIYAEPPIYKPTDCKFYEECKRDGFKTHHWSCNAFGCHTTATEVDPDSRTITVTDTGGAAPAPTVEMVQNAYKRTLNREGQRTPASYLLRDLYPSAFKE